MAVPFTVDVNVVRFHAAGGKTTCVPFRAVRRGFLSRLRVIQLDGNLDGFTYALYSRYDAARVQDDNTPPPFQDSVVLTYSGGPEGKVPSDPTFPTPAASPLYMAYRITAERTVTSTHRHDDPAGFNLWQGFNNCDSIVGVNTLDRLYLVISPSGSGSKEFALDICVDTPSQL